MPHPDPNATAGFDPAAGAADTRTFGDGAPPATSAPTSVPGYEIEAELGRGGMGVVYKARDTRLDRPVALKIVLGGGHASAAALGRFVVEAKAAAAVRHPGIAQVYELGEHAGLPFMAMEFCPGGSLADSLGGVPLPATRAAELVEKLAVAVQAAHAAGVVHRDLKPANVLLAADGSPRVGDFGLARRDDGGSGLTAAGAVLGSPSYMAPEQAAGSAEIGPPADVYGLGTVLYECLTGRPPFRAATALETVSQVLTADPVPPSRLVPAVPRDLDTVCLRCLHKAPSRRYPSAAALADDLRRVLDGRPITARPVGAAERAWKWARRRPAAASAAAVTVIAVAAVVGVVLWTNRSLQAERDAARHAEQAADEARARADAARTRAEARLVAALDAVERMLVRTAGERWARDPALQAERRAVLEDAIAVYRSFPAEDAGDPRVRRQTALAEARVAAAYLALADYPRAGRAAAAAEAIQADLTTASPTDPDLANELALTLVQLGHTHVLSNRFDDAKGCYDRAAEEARRAVVLAPARDDIRLTLAEAVTAQGHFSMSSAGGEAGARYHAEVVALARELTARPDPGYGAKLFLAIGLLNTAAADAARGRPIPDATLAEAEAVLAGLVGQAAPAARLADLADHTRGQLFVFQGQAALRRRDGATALARADAGLALTERQLAAQPKSFPLRMQQLNALALRSDALRRLGRDADAAEATRLLVERCDAVAAAAPSLGWLRFRFAGYRSIALVDDCRAGAVPDFDRRVADLLAATPPGGPLADTVRYNVACARAQASRSGSLVGRVWSAAGAVADLTALARSGYFAAPARAALLRTDPDLEPLRQIAELQPWLAELTHSAPAPPR